MIKEAKLENLLEVLIDNKLTLRLDFELGNIKLLLFYKKCQNW